MQIIQMEKNCLNLCSWRSRWCNALLFGHDKQEEKSLCLQVNGDPIELKNDYQEKYEPVIMQTVISNLSCSAIS